MKNEELIVLGLAGVAVWLILQSQKPKAAKTPASGAMRTEEIFDQWGAKFSNGWRYFTDGTAIDPQGRYFKDGQMIWAPTK